MALSLIFKKLVKRIFLIKKYPPASNLSFSLTALTLTYILQCPACGKKIADIRECFDFLFFKLIRKVLFEEWKIYFLAKKWQITFPNTAVPIYLIRQHLYPCTLPRKVIYLVIYLWLCTENRHWKRSPTPSAEYSPSILSTWKSRQFSRSQQCHQQKLWPRAWTKRKFDF